MYPTTGTILFSSGLNQVVFSLNILDDDDPELEETFTLILSQPTGGATLNTQAARSTFTIRYKRVNVGLHDVYINTLLKLLKLRANDAPYGRFTIEDPSITVDQRDFSDISRTFLYKIVRENGLIGDVFLRIVTIYNEVRR